MNVNGPPAIAPIQGQTGELPSQWRGQNEGAVQAPPAPPVIVCAPGLEYLACLDQIIIRQRLQIFQGCSCERRNRYVASNSMGQIIYNMTEYSERGAHFWHGRARSFEMDVLDHRNAVVMHFVRPLRCMISWCCCDRQEMEVQAPPGNVMAMIRQEFSMCGPKFSIKDRNSRRVLDIVAPACKTGVPCDGVVEFAVLSTNGVVIGKITKLWGGALTEVFTTANNFGVTFPLDLDVHIKGALIAATILIVSNGLDIASKAACRLERILHVLTVWSSPGAGMPALRRAYDYMFFEV
ncbi:phospholipid scramblase family member 5-like isoform X2 [Dermacentor albipictus]|uniref:phospholipid scramblase family member 5-like isoform X2 n=1 Tax=Dermacentor albipictus TaxID=60249 RepID=UPI0031FDF985